MKQSNINVIKRGEYFFVEESLESTCNPEYADCVLQGRVMYNGREVLIMNGIIVLDELITKHEKVPQDD